MEQNVLYPISVKARELLSTPPPWLADKTGLDHTILQQLQIEISKPIRGFQTFPNHIVLLPDGISVEHFLNGSGGITSKYK